VTTDGRLGAADRRGSRRAQHAAPAAVHPRNKLGALNLYSRQGNAYTEDNLDEAIAIAAHAAVAAAQHIDQLGIGMARRTLIGQAVGILMERYNLDADRAFSVLVRLSSTENRKLFDIASELVDQRRRPTN
jgi:hypothetical protein